jgi:tetratricopeptide (TPR) repeat protein
MRKINILDIVISDFTETIGLNPNDVENYYRRGLAYDNNDQQNEAIIDFSKTINLKPDYADAYLRRSLCYKKIGLYAEAINDYNEVIKLKPEYAGLAILYGFITKTIAVGIL